MESDVSYFTRRASDELRAALKAMHPEARQRHVELAERYNDLANAITARHRYLGLPLGTDPTSASDDSVFLREIVKNFEALEEQLKQALNAFSLKSDTADIAALERAWIAAQRGAEIARSAFKPGR